MEKQAAPSSTTTLAAALLQRFPESEKNERRWYLPDSFAKIPIYYVPTVSALGTACVVLTCYFLAVSAGHARLLAPMISDCFARKPESYIAGWGMAVFVCAGLCANVLVMAGYLNRFEATSAAEFQLRAAAVSFGLVACAGYGVVSVVTERDDNLLHCTGALVAFFAYYCYAIATTSALHRRRREGAIGTTSLRCKFSCIAVGFFAIVCYCSLVANDAMDDGVDGDRAFAVCEWMAVLCMAAFNLSCWLDYGNDLVLLDVWPLVFSESSKNADSARVAPSSDCCQATL